MIMVLSSTYVLQRDGSLLLDYARPLGHYHYSSGYDNTYVAFAEFLSLLKLLRMAAPYLKVDGTSCCGPPNGCTRFRSTTYRDTCTPWKPAPICKFGSFCQHLITHTYLQVFFFLNTSRTCC